MDLSASEPATPTPHVLAPQVALLFAAVLFGLAVRDHFPAAGLILVVGIVLSATALLKERAGVGTDGERHPMAIRLLIAVMVFSLLGVLGWAPSTFGPSTELLERAPAAIWGVLAFALFVKRGGDITKGLSLALVAMTMATTLVIGILHLDAVEGVGLDVYLLHDAAADAIADGQNPYTNAVEVPDGAPTAEPGQTITGYPYPPVTALAYAAGVWIFGEPRYTSLISWLGVLGVVGAQAVRRRSRESLYVLLLLASIPGWPLVLRAGWTEPLSLMLLTAAFFAWRAPARSGLGLGLGLASKQYFAVAAPLALLHRDNGWARRLLVAAVTVAVTVGAAVAIDLGAFWSAAVEFHMGTPPRADSSNLVGLLDTVGVSWAPPAFLGLAAGAIIAVATGRISRTARSFVVGLSLTLAVAFFLSTQAFANYWFLITGLCCLGLIDYDEARPVSPHPDDLLQVSSDTG